MSTSPAVAAMRTAARALGGGDPREILVAVQQAQDALDAVKAEQLRVMEDTKAYEDDGASSLKVWTSTMLRLPAAQTHQLLAAARTVPLLPPELGEAFEAGEIRGEHMRFFTHGLRHLGSTIMGESAGAVLEVAKAAEPNAVRDIVRTIREAIYPDSLDEAWARGMDRQDIQVNPVPEGYHVNGFLPITTGAKLETVLDSLGAPRDADDARTGAERRVEALDVLLDGVLQNGLPSDKGIRPQLSVIVDADTFAASQFPDAFTRAVSGTQPGMPAQLAGFGNIGPSLLGYLSCGSDITPILTTTRNGKLPQANVLNLGRTERLANRAQRRAIAFRQGGICATPGCKGRHLEIHHVTWWSEGGRTDLDELTGICPRCHHLVHRGLLIIKALGDGQFTFTNKDHRPLRDQYRQRMAAWREAHRIARITDDIRHRRRQRDPQPHPLLA